MRDSVRYPPTTRLVALFLLSPLFPVLGPRVQGPPLCSLVGVVCQIKQPEVCYSVVLNVKKGLRRNSSNIASRRRSFGARCSKVEPGALAVDLSVGTGSGDISAKSAIIDNVIRFDYDSVRSEAHPDFAIPAFVHRYSILQASHSVELAIVNVLRVVRAYPKRDQCEFDFATAKLSHIERIPKFIFSQTVLTRNALRFGNQRERRLRASDDTNEGQQN